MRIEDRGTKIWATVTADMARYVGPEVRAWSLTFIRRLLRQMYVHPGAFAVLNYRFGQWTEYRCKIPVIRHVLQVIYHLGFCCSRFVLGIEIPFGATIDAGLLVYHYGGIIVHSHTVAGKNLQLNHGVIIGDKAGVPRFGDNVSISSRAVLFGPIEIGDRVLVGAGSVVTKSFPSCSIVAGVPARLLRKRDNPVSSTAEEALNA